MTIVESENTTFIATTNDVDIEAGYPAFERSFSKVNELPAIVSRANKLGVPLYRITILETGIDDEGNEYMENLGNLDDYID